MTEPVALAMAQVDPPSPRGQARDGTAAVRSTPLAGTERRRVRRTVIVLAIVAGFFYLLSFVQILLMK